MGTFLSVALVGLLLAAPPLSPQDGGPVVAWIAAHQYELPDEYEAFLRLPNVATDEAAIRRNAEALVAMMEQSGTAATEETASAPARHLDSLKGYSFQLSSDGPIIPCRFMARSAMNRHAKKKALRAEGLRFPGLSRRR